MADICADAAAIGIGGMPSRGDVAAMRPVVLNERRARDDYGRLSDDRRLAHQQWTERIASLELLAAVVTVETTLLTEQEQAWEDWKRSERIPERFTADGIDEFFQELRLAREALAQLDRAEHEYQSLYGTVRSAEEKIGDVLARIGITVNADSQKLLVQLGRVADDCRRNEEASVQAADLDAQVEEHMGAVNGLQQEVAESQAALDELLHSVGVKDIDEFRRGINLTQQKRALEQRIDELTGQIDGRLGTEVDSVELQATLELGDINSWNVLQAQLDNDKLTAESERVAAIEACQDAVRSLHTIEGSSDVVTREHELAGLIEAGQAALREWRVARLAEELVKETLARFQRDRQPPVLADASLKFALVTDGEYAKVVQRDSEIVIHRRDQRKVEVKHLSRGTREQLYVCLRLALASHVGERTERLPLVMDDVLVNFDPERARAIAERLCEFSRDHQILLFTCHPSTADLMRKIDPTCGRIDMVRYDGGSPQVQVPVPI